MSDPVNTEPPTEPTKKSGLDKERFLETVKTLQFAWFVGHVVTLTSIIFYTLTYFRVFKYPRFWYLSALFGIIESFGILIYQVVTKQGAQPKSLVKDDNAQYFLLGFLFIILRPYVLIALLPFALFSLFHVLAYTKGYLLPAFGLEDHSLSKQIGSFISNNNTKSIELASLLEIYSLGWFFLRLITFRKNSLFPFAVYLVFIKLRFEKSYFTRNYTKSLEVEADKLVNRLNSPAAKDVWLKVKSVFRTVGGIHLVNDYTKEKST